MPQAIPFALSAIGSAVGGTLGTALVAGAIVSSIALSDAQRRKQQRLARAQFDAAQVDRLSNLPLTEAPRTLVLGRARVGGTPFFQQSWGPFKDTLIRCIALAGHEIDAVEQVYFDEQPVSIDAAGNVTSAPYARELRWSATENMQSTTIVLQRVPDPASVSVVATDSTAGGQSAQTPFRPEFTLTGGNTLTIEAIEPGWNYTVSYQWVETVYYARVFVHLGQPGQTASARLQAYFPGVWTDAHRAQGVAYLECEFVFDETAFPSGLPNVTALVRGSKIYDPRTGLAQFTENPALMQRHVLLHPQFGKRASISTAEDAQIVAAANGCDLPISYTGADLVPMFRAAGVYAFGTPARELLDDLAQAMGGNWAYAAGQFFVRAGVYQLPVMNLTDADLATVQIASDGSRSQSPISISPHRPRNEKFNTVVPRIWDQGANYVLTPIAPVKADALIASDGAVLSQEVAMQAVFYAPQAFHIAGIMLRDSRDPMTAVLTFKLTAYPLQLFDGVTLTLERFGLAAKEFQVMGRSFIGGLIVLTLKETSFAIYAYGAGFLPRGYASNSGLPRPWDISPPAILAVSSGESELIVQTDGTVVNGVRVTWSQSQDASVLSGGSIEVQYTVLDGNWRGVTVPGAETQAVFTGIPDRAVIALRIRARSSIAVSDWSLHFYHQVVGKTEPPPNIQNLSVSGSVFSWSMPRRVPDLAGFVFRFHYGSNTDWGTAAPLHDGLVTENPWEPKKRPGGVVTVMGKARDTTGNESPATANIVMNLGDAPIANVVDQWDFDALGWPYVAAESSGWTLVSGDPSADALDSFYGTDDQSFYGADTESFYEPSAYGQMVYVTPEIAVGSALAGSVMTLATVTEGGDLRIDYRLAGPGSMYEADSASFYGADADPFYDPPGEWLPWPGQLVAANDIYQFRVTIGAGAVRGILHSMVLTIDAPDLEEEIADFPIGLGGSVIPLSLPFANVKTVIAQLQTNGSGAVNAQINKTNPLAPVITAFNSAGVSVAGATADIRIRGY